MRRAALVTALFAVAAVGLARIDLAGGSRRADLLLPAQAADGLVPRGLQPLLSRLRERTETAVARQRTTLGKTLSLERIVHTAVRPTGSDCWGFATVMVALGRELGLPVRVTVAAASASAYDTHTTVSVWLPLYRRWAIVDPTFGGTFTRSDGRRPLNAVDLQKGLSQGWWRQIVWHPSAADSTPLSSYYVDPILLFRYVGTVAEVDGGPTALVLPDSLVIPDTTYVVSRRALAAGPPGRAVRAWTSQLKRMVASRSVALPPDYAPQQVSQRRIALPATIRVPRGSVVVWTSRPGVGVDWYATMAVAGGSLSPIFVSDGKVRLTGYGLSTVRVFSVLRFGSAQG